MQKKIVFVNAMIFSLFLCFGYHQLEASTLICECQCADPPYPVIEIIQRSQCTMPACNRKQDCVLIVLTLTGQIIAHFSHCEWDECGTFKGSAQSSRSQVID